MDPNETLDRLRELTDFGDTHEDVERTLDEVSDLFTAMDDWLSRGGFLPDDWRKNR
jgi:hypothetical protein